MFVRCGTYFIVGLLVQRSVGSVVSNIVYVCFTLVCARDDIVDRVGVRSCVYAFGVRAHLLRAYFVREEYFALSWRS